MMNFKEACGAVADLFEALPETYTAGTAARDEQGYRVSANDPSAVCWCAIGGVAAAMSDRTKIVNLYPFAKKIGYSSVTHANDHGGRLVAIKMLRLAAGVA